MSKLERYAKEIKELLKELNFHKSQKDKFIKDVERVKEEKMDLRAFLRGRTEEDWLNTFDKNILKILIKIEELNLAIADKLVEKPFAGIPKVVKLQKLPKPEGLRISGREKRAYIKELELNKEALKRLKKKEKPETTQQIQYTIYSSAWYGRLANYFFENLSLYLTRRYAEFFRGLTNSLMSSSIRILSKTYISLMLFLSSLTFFLILLGSGVYSYFTGTNVVITLVSGFSIAFLGFIAMFLLFYFYPSLVANMKKRAIRNDLPFIIIHMAAIAGSGAQPIAMFNLVLSSEEYPGLKGEIKKIVNYVNLFGYDISTALKVVAATTPSTEFKDLLTGITSTIEGGGDLKNYLDGKAKDALSTYRLEREKYTSTISTYSDVYIGILIAAPLLFIVTLAIINILGGNIAGIDVSTLATIGTYGIIPFLNVLFILFMNIIQPSM